MKKTPPAPARTELVIITGLSGSGKGTVLKALEDIGYYSVDNLPIELIPKFAQLAKDSPEHPACGACGRYSRGSGAQALPRPVQENQPGSRHSADFP